MLDINGGEVLFLLVIALFLFGPERLPKFAREAARVVRQVKLMAAQARSELSGHLGEEFKDLDLHSLRDLNPRTLVTRTLLDDTPRPPAPSRSVSPRPARPPVSGGERPPYDPDAT
ncbi:MAG: sec-independent translocase [Actinomycetes bacterium]